jgi:hypothetical protein
MMYLTKQHYARARLSDDKPTARNTQEAQISSFPNIETPKLPHIKRG